MNRDEYGVFFLPSWKSSIQKNLEMLNSGENFQLLIFCKFRLWCGGL